MAKRYGVFQDLGDETFFVGSWFPTLSHGYQLRVVAQELEDREEAERIAQEWEERT